MAHSDSRGSTWHPTAATERNATEHIILRPRTHALRARHSCDLVRDLSPGEGVRL